MNMLLGQLTSFIYEAGPEYRFNVQKGHVVSDILRKQIPLTALKSYRPTPQFLGRFACMSSNADKPSERHYLALETIDDVNKIRQLSTKFTLPDFYALSALEIIRGAIASRNITGEYKFIWLMPSPKKGDVRLEAVTKILVVASINNGGQILHCVSIDGAGHFVNDLRHRLRDGVSGGGHLIAYATTEQS